MTTEQGQLFFQNNGQSIHMLDVPIKLCRHSRFNTRKTRSEKDIQKLADRIRSNGFERTRALWAVEVDGGYEVFAGGTRLEAAKLAEIETVPLMLHVGYEDDAISGRADIDNENDEYHAKVPLPDEWAECLRLEVEEGWIHQRIADAKHLNRATITLRLQYARFSNNVITMFVKNDFLRESHALEISQLLDFNMAPWLIRDDAMLEVLNRVVGKDGTHRGGSEGKSPTAEIFRKHVKEYNTMLQAAEAAIKEFPASVDDDGTPFIPRTAFLEVLAKKKIRTAKDIIAESGIMNLTLQGIERRRIARLALEQRRLTEEQEAAERETLRLQQEAERKAHLEYTLSRLQHGDCRQLIPQRCPNRICLVLTDPPYGKQFQSHRRVVSEKKPIMTGDTSIEEASILLGEMLAAIKPKLSENAHLFIFTDQDSYIPFVAVIEASGLTRRRTMTWLKGNHGMGDVTGGESLYEAEWIIHAVHGNPKLTDGIARPEILKDFPGDQDSEHPTEKPLALLRHLVQRGSEPGQVVVDPFAGTANSLLAAIAEGRLGWACEVDEHHYQRGAEKLYTFVTERIE